MYKNRVSTSYARLSLASAICLAVHGQFAAAQTDVLLEEIIVTAQFREQNLQDTPLSITALSADMMAARNQFSIEDIAAQAPNVNLNTMGGAFGPSIGSHIRGVGQFDFNPAYEPGVGMYVDDVYYPTLTGANFDLLDLERVEILRGPQGTLTGRNSIGGAIKLISRKPQEGGNGFFEAAYGSRHRLDIRAASDFQLTDSLFGRVSGVYKRQDGFVRRVDYGCANPDNPEGIAATRAGDCTVDKMGDEGYAGARASLRYSPTTSLDVVLSADFTDMDRSAAADVLVISDRNPNYICGDRCNYATYQNAANDNLPPGTLPSASLPATNMPSNVTFRSEGWSLNADWSVNEALQLQSITAYRTYESEWGTDDDFTPDPLIASAGLSNLDHDFFSQEFRLSGSLGESIDYTVGAYYSDQKTVYFTLQDIRYLPPIPQLNNGILQFKGDDPVTADSAAVFGTLMFSLTDALSMTAGIRYTEESKRYKFVRLNWDDTEGAPIVDPLNGLVSEYEGEEVDYRLSLDYRFHDGLMIYSSFSTGFKGGGVAARPFTPGQAINGAFDVETIDAVEFGVKSNPLQNSTLNLAVFWNDYQDKQMPILDCSELDGFPGAPCAATANAGDGVIKGVEAEFTVVFGSLAIDAALSYLDTEWDFIDPKVGGTYQKSDPMTFLTPDKKFSLGLQYDFDLGDGGSIYTRVDAVYSDEIFTDRTIDNEPNYFPSTTVASARVAWRDTESDLEVALLVTNLTNEDIFLTRFAAVYPFTGTAYDTLGDPREWALSIKYNF